MYERVMITRLTKTIEKHGLLDSSQYGAVAGGGCPAPLKVLNDVMEDLRVSGQELHVVALDHGKRSTHVSSGRRGCRSRKAARAAQLNARSATLAREKERPPK